MIHSFYSSAQPSGENSVVRNELEALRDSGHTVRLFAARTDDLETEFLYPLRAGLRVASGRGHNPLEAVRNFAPDVLYVHNLFPNFGTSWLRSVKEPIVLTLHNYRPVCANGTFVRDGMLCRKCSVGRRWPAARHGCYRDSRAASSLVAIGTTFAPSVVALASRVRLLSATQQRTLADSGMTIDGRFTVIPNFLRESSNSRIASADTERRQWAWIGRPESPEKGLERLLRWWPVGEHLVVAGGANPFGAHAEQVTYRGMLGPREVDQMLAGSVGHIVSSLVPETFGLTAIESLRAGTPVLAPTGTAVGDLIHEYGVGATYDSPSTLRDAMREVKDGGQSLRDLCLDVFLNNFAEAIVMPRLEKALAEATGR